MKKTFCALAILFATSVPVLAAPVDVPVTGTIEPVACTLSLPAGGTIDLGVISPATLNDTGYTLLPEKQIDITLECDAPTKMGLTAENRRPGTMAGVTESTFDTAKPPSTAPFFGNTNVAGVGLGVAGTAKIGGYGIRLAQGSVTADGNPVDVLTKGESETAWAKSSTGTLYQDTIKRHITWGATGTVVPIAFERMVGKLGAQIYINKKSELDLSKTITLDGLTALELVYL